MVIVTSAGARATATRKSALFDDAARRLPEIARISIAPFPLSLPGSVSIDCPASIADHDTPSTGLEVKRVGRRLRGEELSSPRNVGGHSLKVVVAQCPVVAPAAEAATLESGVRNRRGRGRCGRASR